MMQERGVSVDHSTVNRWAIRFLPLLEKVFRKHKRPVGVSWRMDETYIKVHGKWKYLYRAVDKEGDSIDFLLRAKRDKTAALRFFVKAMRANGDSEKVTIDQSGSNKAAMEEINKDREVPILVSEKIQRRHVMSPPRFEDQTNDTASGQIYFRIFQSMDGVASLGTIGFYEFAVAKQQGQWYIDRWIVRLDSKPDHL